MHPTPPPNMASDLGKTLKSLPEACWPLVPCQQPFEGQSLDSCVCTPNWQLFCDKEQLQSRPRPLRGLRFPPRGSRRLCGFRRISSTCCYVFFLLVLTLASVAVFSGSLVRHLVVSSCFLRQETASRASLFHSFTAQIGTVGTSNAARCFCCLGSIWIH